MVIDELHKGINNAVHVMARGRKQAYEAIEESVEAENSLGAITESVIKINDMSIQIATAATEQSAVAEEMNRNVDSISLMSAGTVENASFNSESSKRLTVLAEEMQKHLSTFDLGRSRDSHGSKVSATTDDVLF